MAALSRRSLLLSGLASAAVAGAPVYAKAKPRIVIVGGGAAGVSAARVFANTRLSVDVTLIEPNAAYEACFGSNAYLGRLRKYRELLFDYRALSSFGIDVVRDRVIAIDRQRRELRLSHGSRIVYDALVLSPGVALDFTSIPGYGEEAARFMPHAWTAGDQLLTLSYKLGTVPDNGLIVVIAAPGLSRCPSAPYERVLMITHTLKSTGRGRCKIVILDPKTRFPMQALFQEAWDKHYTAMIEWLTPDIYSGIVELRPATNTVVTGFETYDAALVNVIPAQTAGQVTLDAGLNGANGFCAVDPLTMGSLQDERIYIAGDAADAGPIPKSASAAISQGAAAARSILAALTGAQPSAPTYESLCWSQLAPEDCIALAGTYSPQSGQFVGREQIQSRLGDDVLQRLKVSMEARAWYSSMTRALFA